MPDSDTHTPPTEEQPPKGPRVDEDDPVEEAAYEPFRASDPPPFNPGAATASEEEDDDG